MSLLDTLMGYNPFAHFFKKVNEKDDQLDKEAIVNSQGVSEVELQLMNSFKASNSTSTNMGMGGIIYTGIAWEPYFANKLSKVSQYRQMAFYPEVSDSLDAVCNAAIVTNSEGQIADLFFKKELPRHIEEQLMTEWKYLYNKVFHFDDNGWDIFRKWLIDSEIYIELVLNKEGNDIIDFKILSPITMMPIYEDNKIIGFTQTISNINNLNATNNGYGDVQSITNIFDKHQIVYSNFGLYVDGLDSRGYLETAIKVYNQLKNLEDAVVIYRIARSTERRVWNIPTGRMPKGKAEEYIRNLMQKYRKRITYDEQTGAMSTTQNIMALTEDYWFGIDEQGNGAKIDTIGGGFNLGELDDLKYFLKKLYKTLKLPRSRWDDSAGVNYSSGKSGDILREELEFTLMVERFQKNFSEILMKSFITQLKLRGFDDKYTDEDNFNIKFTTSNLFKEYKEMELYESKFSMLTSIDQLMYDKENNPKGLFAPEFIIKEVLKIPDQVWQKNIDLLEKMKMSSPNTDELGQTGEIAGGGNDFPTNTPEPPSGGGGSETTGTEEAPTEPTETTPTPELTSPAEVAPESVEKDKPSKFGDLFTNWYNKNDGFSDKNVNSNDGLIDNIKKL